MSDHDKSQAEGEVKSFHLADKEHSFHLVGDESHESHESDRSDAAAGDEPEVKSFQLAGNEHSFHKE